MSTMASTGGGAAQSTGAAPASTGVSASTGGSTGTGYVGSTIGSTGSAANDFRWNEGWRERLAGGDQKTLQRLGRFTDPEQVWKSYTELERRMSSGELKPTLPKDPLPEELVAFRKELGIPDKAEDYLKGVKLAEGLVIGEDDKPIINGFLKAAHASNYTPAHVQGAIEWYYQNKEAQAVAQQDRDLTVARDTQDKLRIDWPGVEYRANVNALHSLLDQAPPIVMADGTKVPFKDQFLNARLPDGTPLGSSVSALKWVASLSREINPAATVVPGVGAQQVQAIDDEITKLKSLMGDRRSEYWKGPKADGHQKRYRELLEAKEKMAARGKAVA